MAIGLTVGCGKNRTYSLHGLENLPSDENREWVLDAASEMNKQTKRNFVEPNGTGYPVTVTVVNNAPPNRMGHAIAAIDGCKIELTSSILDDKDRVKAVMIHELGHCAGLEHSPVDGDVMYAYTVGWSNYSQDSVQSFAHRLLGSVAVH